MSTSGGSSRLGEVFQGRFRLEALVGEGGFGRVYRGVQLGITERPVAIKVLLPERRETNHAARFREEARAVSRVSHPHALRVYDFGQTDAGELYMVTELLEGEALRDLLAREGRLDAARAVRIAVQALKALGEVHDQGIVHRDLKPENLFMCRIRGEDDFVKIIDFGIAYLAREPGAQRLTKEHASIGTPWYMSPEQIVGENVGPACDLYSLGTVLYEMIAGRPPFHGDAALAIMLAHMNEPAPPLGQVHPGVPAHVEAAVMSCLSKDPAARPAHADDLRERLERPLQGEAAVAPAHFAATTLVAEIAHTAPTFAAENAHTAPTVAAETPTVADPAGRSHTSFHVIVAARARFEDGDDPGAQEEALELYGGAQRTLEAAAEPFDVTPVKRDRSGEHLWVVGTERRSGDDPLHGARLAAALQVAFERWSEQPDLPELGEITLHTGVHGGDLLEVRDPGAELRMTGSALDAACELAAGAPGGRVALSAGMAAVIQPATGEALHLAGSAKPGWALPPGALLDPAQRMLSDVLPPITPFVGREEPLAMLSARWSRVRDTGRAGLVWIVGDVGLGKTRLVRELAGEAVADVAMSVCVSRDKSPFSALRPLLYRWAGIEPGDGGGAVTARLERAVGELLGGGAHSARVTDELLPLVLRGIGPIADLPTLASADGLCSDAATEALLAVLVARTARRGGMIWIVDRVEHIDPSSAEVLRRCASADAPLLVVGTARPRPSAQSDSEEPWRSTLLQSGVRIMLDPLRASEVRDLLRSHPDPRVRAQEGRSEELTAACGGNPLLLEELIRRVADGADGASLRTTSDTLEPGARLAAWLEDRLGAVGAAERRLLEACAIADSPFPADAVAHTAELDLDTTWPLLRSLAREGWIESAHLACATPESCAHLTLATPLAGNLLRRVMVRTRRRRLHGRWAAFVQAQPERFRLSPEHLAEHCEQAGQLGQAVDLWLEASGQACRLGAPTEARPPLDRARACLQRHVRSAKRSGATDGEVAALKAAVARQTALVDYYSGDSEACVQSVDAALAELPAGPDPGGRPLERAQLQWVAARGSVSRGGARRRARALRIGARGDRRPQRRRGRLARGTAVPGQGPGAAPARRPRGRPERGGRAPQRHAPDRHEPGVRGDGSDPPDALAAAWPPRSAREGARPMPARPGGVPGAGAAAR